MSRIDQLAEEAKRRPTDARVWCALARELAGAGHYGAAREALERARTAAAGAEDLNTLGATLEGLGDSAGAVAVYREALRLLRTTDSERALEALETAHLGLGRALLAQNDADAAVLTLRVAAQRRPHSASVHLALAGALDRQGRLEEAQRAAERAVDLDRDRSEGHRVLAHISARLGRPDDRIEALRQLSVIAPEDIRVALELAVSLSSKGEPTEALDLIQQVSERIPQTAANLRQLGAAWSTVGDHGEAVRVQREAVRLDPNDVASHVALGEALIAAQSTREAVVALEAAAGLEPSSVEILARLGELLLAQGRAGEAVPTLVRAAAMAPEDLELRKLLSRALEVEPSSSESPRPEAGRLVADVALLSVPGLVDLLMQREVTGRLRVEARDGARGALEFHRGQIVGAAFSPGISLRAHLRKMGVDLEGAPVGLEEASPGLAEWILEARRLDPEALLSVLRSVSGATLDRMASITRGFLEFEARLGKEDASFGHLSVVIDEENT